MEGNGLIKNEREQPTWAHRDLDKVREFGA